MTDQLPVPEREASTAVSHIDGAIHLIESAIGTRAARAADLTSWSGLKRLAWDEQWAYSQGDLAVAVDDLQGVRAEVTHRLEEIRGHNVDVRRAEMAGELVAPWALPAGTGSARS